MKNIITLLIILLSISLQAQIRMNTKQSFVDSTRLNATGDSLYHYQNGVLISTEAITIGLDSGVTGTLPIANGGTGATSLSGANIVTGSGTANYLPKFTSSSAIGNSSITDNGSLVQINNSSTPSVLRLGTTTGGLYVIQDFYTNSARTGYIQAYDNDSTIRVFDIAADEDIDLRLIGATQQFLTGGSERMRIDASGNVGVSTTSPWEALSIPFNEKLSFGSSTYPISISRSSAGELVTTIADSYNSIYTRIDFKMRAGSVDEQTPLSITGAGTVGIGATSPNSLLQITAAAGLSHARWTESATTVGFVGGANGIITGYNGSFAVRGESGLVLSGQGNAPNVYINSSGNVGIGTTNMSSGIPLTLNAATGLNTNIAFQQNSVDKWFIRNINGTDALSFFDVTASSERMRITSSGNVGIGTSTDAGYKLDVNGNARTTSNLLAERVQVGTNTTINEPTGVGNTLQFANYTASAFVSGNIDAYVYKISSGISNLSPHTLIFQTRSDGTLGGGFAFVGGSSPAVQLHLNASGNVGIGTTSPTSAKLQVRGAGTTVSTNSIFVDNSNNAGLFAIRDNGDAFILGNVGIGEINPSTKLQVSGSSVMIKLNATANTFAQLGYYENDSLKWNAYNDYSTDNYVITNSGGPKLYLTPVGNLGLGVTPSAWSAGTRALQVGTYGALAWSGGVDIGMTNNAYYNGTDWVYIQSQEAARYLNNRNTFAWYIAPAGTAGNPITFTQAMTLDASGRLGIGETSPSASAKLHVNGTTKTTSADIGTTAGDIFISNLNRLSFTGAPTIEGQSSTKPLLIGTVDAQSLILYTNASERMRITSGGDVGIGTDEPNSKLSIDGVFNANTTTNFLRINDLDSDGGYFAIQDGTGTTGRTAPSFYVQGKGDFGNNTSYGAYFAIYKDSLATENDADVVLTFDARRRNNEGDTIMAATNGLTFLFANNGTSQLAIHANGNVGIGTTSPSEKLDVNGKVRIRDLTQSVNLDVLADANGVLGVSSDERLKIYDSDISDAINIIKGLYPKYYYWKDNAVKRDLGFYAQEVNAVLPEAATPMNNDGFYGLNSRAIIAVSVKAIQEQQAIIETQQQKITDLETTIQSLITRIENLENK